MTFPLFISNYFIPGKIFPKSILREFLFWQTPVIKLIPLAPARLHPPNPVHKSISILSVVVFCFLGYPAQHGECPGPDWHALVPSKHSLRHSKRPTSSCLRCTISHQQQRFPVGEWKWYWAVSWSWNWHWWQEAYCKSLWDRHLWKLQIWCNSSQRRCKEHKLAA